MCKGEGDGIESSLLFKIFSTLLLSFVLSHSRSTTYEPFQFYIFYELKPNIFKQVPFCFCAINMLDAICVCIIMYLTCHFRSPNSRSDDLDGSRNLHWDSFDNQQKYLEIGKKFTFIHFSILSINMSYVLQGSKIFNGLG